MATRSVLEQPTPSPRNARPAQRMSWTMSLGESLSHLHRAIDDLDLVLRAHGTPGGEPFSGTVVPSRRALAELAPEDAAEAAIAIVHKVFGAPGRVRVPRAVSTAAKLVGTAARKVRYAAAREPGSSASAADLAA